MPELPEVETIARTLRAELTGAPILGADLRWRRTLAHPSPLKFKQQIQGQLIREIGRRGKFLRINLRDYSLLIHLRMSGDLSLRKTAAKPEKHDRLVLDLTDGRQLVFNDTRKFGRVWLTDNEETVVGRLGPEPLSEAFTQGWLYESLIRRRRRIKQLLLDQNFLAGMGNIYTDEALHMAKLHPLTASDKVNRKRAGTLHTAIRNTLEEGIRRNGASIDWVYRGGDYQNHFRVYGRAGKPCLVCGTKVKRIVVGQRSTFYCPHCQAR